MCLFPGITCLAIFLPYFWLLCMPLYGSFSGTEPVVRFSLMMQFQAIIMSAFPVGLVSFIPCLELVTLCVLMCLPVSLTPFPVVWLYDKLLWLSEPVWMLTEVLIPLEWAMAMSQKAVDRLDEEPTNLAKGMILGLSTLCYAVMLYFGIELYRLYSDSTLTVCMLCILLALSVLCHIMMWKVDEGIIVDAAFVSVFSMLFLYCYHIERVILQNPLPKPDTWKRIEGSISYLGLLYSFTNASLLNANRAMQFMKKLFSPVFVLFSLLRLFSVLTAVGIVVRKGSDQEEECDMDDDRFETHFNSLIRKSPVVVRLSVIFVYTQLVTHHLQSAVIEPAV
ncbi:uncharacterized protein LOC106177571, partial [Lingula anatina]|uniref:Uncharacterized protein LOC106177571 n=1 Tax=Lingula anatina TaxID=7574 RepID=A0A1S3K0N7_LINAN